MDVCPNLGKQKWIVIEWPFLVEINGHGNICNKLGVVSKGLSLIREPSHTMYMYM